MWGLQYRDSIGLYGFCRAVWGLWAIWGLYRDYSRDCIGPYMGINPKP